MFNLTNITMMSKLFLKPHHIPFPLPLSSLFFPQKPSLSLPLPTFSIPHFSTTNPNPNPSPLSYGPSLHKGTPTSPSQFPQPQNDAVLLEETFTRVFHLAALRVPSTECFALESRLRGHLLNWPRIRNIARVPGDDVDPDVAPLLGHPINGDGDGNGNGEEEEDEERGLVSLQRRIYGKAEGDGDVLSPVLYRDKLAKTFNTRGFVKFRNLAKISRPNKKKKKKVEEGSGEGDEKRVGKNGFAEVEVVEDDEGGGGLRNLVGEGFGRKKWRGSTRLLLLDERYADRGVEELPEAIKVAACLIFCCLEGASRKEYNFDF